MIEIHSGMVIAGKYRLEATLASGGMGSVWRARHLTLDIPLAVKLIGDRVIAVKETRQRFEREAKAAAALRSPHVVQVFDYGVEEGFPYLVMELLTGEDLGARLKRKGRLLLPETVNIVYQVAQALTRAAQASIVHRDLKPGNIFILRGDDDEELVKVLDFGVAKTPLANTDDDRTKTGVALGSPRYMSPEQARGSKLVDPRSDLWSLGVIAYRAVTGELPFKSNDLLELISKICTATPTPPSQSLPSLGPEVDAFFARALDRDPAQRFQTAREMALAFASATGDRRTPPTPSFRLLTWPPPDIVEPAPPEPVGEFVPVVWACPEPAVSPRLAQLTRPDRSTAPPPPPSPEPVEVSQPAPATRPDEEPPSSAPPSPEVVEGAPPARVTRSDDEPTPSASPSPEDVEPLPAELEDERAPVSHGSGVFVPSRLSLADPISKPTLADDCTTLPAPFEITTTPSTGGVDVSRSRSARSPPRSARAPSRNAIAAGISLGAGLLILSGGLLLLAPWTSRATRPVDAAARPEVTPHPDVLVNPPPPAPRPEPRPEPTATPISAPSAPIPRSKRISPKTPTNRTGTKPNPVLGI